MNGIAQHLFAQLWRNLDADRVVVWYDQRREWESVFRDWLGTERSLDTLPKGAAVSAKVDGLGLSLVVFNGSYLEVRTAVEHLVSVDTPAPVLLYLPNEKPDEENSLLMELECAGKLWMPSLRRFARDVLKEYYTDGKIDDLLGISELRYADVVQWLEQAAEYAGQHGSMLKLVFPGAVQSEELLAKWLASPDCDEVIRVKNATAELQALLVHRLGMKVDRAPTLDELRQRAWRYLLAGEFRSDVDGNPPSALAMIPQPATEPQAKFLRRTVTELRHRFGESYRKMAVEIETSLQLPMSGFNPDRFQAANTFPFQEAALLHWCDQLILEGSYDKAIAVQKVGAASFWATSEASVERQAQWQGCRFAADLGARLSQLEADLSSFSGKPAAWVEAYTRWGGWWEIDRLHRRLENAIAQLEQDCEIERGLGAVRVAYESMLQRMATGFTTALHDAAWQVEGVPSQTSVYSQDVAGAGAPVAFFLVDAMRYEMGQELAQQLAPAGTVQVRTAVAMLPTITKIGMAALMPGSSAGFEVDEEKGRLGARVDGSFLPEWSARKKVWKARVPEIVDFELGTMLDLPPNKLQKRIAGAHLVLVRSTSIDDLGETADNHLARQVMQTVLGNVAKAVRKLANAGIGHFVLTSDHGYQFLQDRGDEMKTDGPGGQTVELHRRCWIGRGGLNPPGTIRVAAAELAYSGTLEFVFPVGLGVFRSGGSLAYHHGGLSLQELVVPVVTLRASTPAAKTASGWKVRITGEPLTLATRAFGVKMELETDALFASAENTFVEVRPALVSGGKEVGIAGLAVGAELDPNSHCLRLELGKEVMVGLVLQEDVEQLRVLAIDPANETVLGESKDIQVKLGI